MRFWQVLLCVEAGSPGSGKAPDALWCGAPHGARPRRERDGDGHHQAVRLPWRVGPNARATVLNIGLARLPHAYRELGRELQIQYSAAVYPVTVEAVGYRSKYDPENVKPQS